MKFLLQIKRFEDGYRIMRTELTNTERFEESVLPIPVNSFQSIYKFMHLLETQNIGNSFNLIEREQLNEVYRLVYEAKPIMDCVDWRAN